MENFENITDDEDFLEFVNLVEHPREPQVYRNREDHFTKWSDTEFRDRFRLSKEVVLFVVEEIHAEISPQTERHHALTAAEMVLLTLRFFATGSMLQVAGDFLGIDKSTASRTVYKVACAIASLRNTYITMPERNEEICFAQQQFFSISRFPKCIGALDCTHIKIQSPGGNEAETFRNRKGFFSYNVQCICNAELQFLNIVCRWPGATHDSQIFRNSSVRRKFENNHYRGSLLLGDSGYAIKPYLLTPLLEPQTPAEHLYNESQIRTRNVIERCFGVWKRRFPILALGIRLNHQKVEAIVVATAVLHNIAQTRDDPEPVINDEVLEALNLVADVPVQRNNRNINGINNSVRHALITDYFTNLL